MIDPHLQDTGANALGITEQAEFETCDPAGDVENGGAIPKFANPPIELRKPP